MQSDRILEEGEVPTQDKNIKIFTYCHGGGRAGRVADALVEKGYEAENIGGLVDWENAGGEVVA